MYQAEQSQPAPLQDPGKYITNRFVDEAGDAVLFDKRGRVIVGSAGCSRFFMIGCASMLQPDVIAAELTVLRESLLKDPYFRGVPSMQPDRKRTALFFHAKDDPPEVRREVFSLLAHHGGKIGFSAVVRDKQAVVRHVKQMNTRSSDYRYNPNELYDQMVRSLFRNQMCNRAGYNIYFAERGSCDRTEALRLALTLARGDFVKRMSPRRGVEPHQAPVHITAAASRSCAGLQVADYFLWSLQRLYERGEDRFLGLLWPSVAFVWDQDEKRDNGRGVWYGADRKNSRRGKDRGRVLTADRVRQSQGYRID